MSKEHHILLALSIINLSLLAASLSFEQGTSLIIQAFLLLILVLVFFASLLNQNRHDKLRYFLWLFFFSISVLNIPLLYFESNNIIGLGTALLSIFGFNYTINSVGTHREIQKKLYEYSPKEKSKMLDKELRGMTLEEPKVEIIYYGLENGQYMASKASKKYHKKDCRYAKGISEKNKILFSDSNQAEKEGYTKCSCIN
ncbi:hypothetical protein JW930_06765 [Candidatus Woesearchaeota archaeon]|nr:hypothetical protein [Candidatus Woesearchaeota archaeon]